MKLKLLGLLIVGLFSMSCNEKISHERPSGVPSTAFWTGGSDGGAWFDCTENEKESATLCSIYSDDGQLWIKALYRLKGLNHGVTPGKLEGAWIDAIPPETIYLVDGPVAHSSPVLA